MESQIYSPALRLLSTDYSSLLGVFLRVFLLFSTACASRLTLEMQVVNLLMKNGFSFPQIELDELDFIHGRSWLAAGDAVENPSST